jgi:hypothetical protein
MQKDIKANKTFTNLPKENGDEFVVVRVKSATAAADDKAVGSVGKGTGSACEAVVAVPRTLPPDLHAMLAKGMRGGVRGAATRPIAIRMANFTQFASTGGSAQAPVFYLDPSVGNQWSSFSGVFDEYRLRSAKVTWYVAYGAPGSAAVDSFVILVFDLTNASVLTGLAQAASFAEKQILNVGNFTSPSSETANGNMVFHPKLPSGVLVSQSSGTTPHITPLTASKDVWYPCTDTLYPSYGYLKWYVPSFGGTIITIVNLIVEFDVEFRFRAA